MTTSRRRLYPQSGRRRKAVHLKPEAEPLVELVAAGGGLVLKIACAGAVVQVWLKGCEPFPDVRQGLRGLGALLAMRRFRPPPGRQYVAGQAASGQRSRMRSSATASGTNTRVRQETI